MCVFKASDGVSGGCKIYTGSGRTSIYPIIGGLRYLYHCRSILVVGVTSEREREERLPSPCVVEEMEVRAIEWSPN